MGKNNTTFGKKQHLSRRCQLNTARRTSLGRFRPIVSISQEVLTRKEGTMPLAPCPLCAASIPPHLTRSDDVDGEKRASIRRRSRTLTGSCERTSGQKKRDGAVHLLCLSIPPSQWSGAWGTASDACNNAPSRRISKHQQQIALAGVTLAAAAASARHQYVLLALALVLICTGWRATLTRFSALGQPSTLRASRSPCSQRRRRSTTLGIAAASVSH